jgi:hypothetical protein
MEDLREHDFIDPVFGYNSRLSKKEFMSKTEDSASWLVDSEEFRAKIYKTAGLPNRYM